jgi:hypothetical protein
MSHMQSTVLGYNPACRKRRLMFDQHFNKRREAES